MSEMQCGLTGSARTGRQVVCEKVLMDLAKDHADKEIALQFLMRSEQAAVTITESRQAQVDELTGELFDIAMRIARQRATTIPAMKAKTRVLSWWCGHSPDTPDDALAVSLCRDISAIR